MSGSGEVEVCDLPLPGKLSGSALVQNAYSLISTGTEGSAVTTRRGWRAVYEKAMASRDRAEDVWKLVKTSGWQKAWDVVQSKLENLIPMGYSSAGVVVEVEGADVPLKPGDRVACMGGGLAVHAEYVTIPKNLLAKVPDPVSLEEASFGALACIAMQGIRRADPTPGETIAVIGLGLIGQLSVRLLSAMGHPAIGLDLDAQRAAMAAELPGVTAWALGDTDSVEAARALTDGAGVDAAIVCAATASSDPTDLACDLCRKKGRVVIVGDVGMDLKRPRIYAKELDVRISCSYGPGRYDDRYEMDGQDYPLGYVRWTEQRNLKLYLEMLERRQIEARSLISKTFAIDEAGAAYSFVKSGASANMAALFEYECAEPPVRPGARVIRRSEPSPLPSGALGVGLIGAGAYARTMRLPILKQLGDDLAVRAVADVAGAAAEATARKAGASTVATDYREILDLDEVDAVIVATRHSSHARIVLDALDAGKHVLVEKPMAITVDDCVRIRDRAAETGLMLRVGFNRRFAPVLQAMRAAMEGSAPRVLAVRVNVGAIGDHWSNSPDEGGRLLGEGVHFLDLCNWFMDAPPRTITACSVGDPAITNPDLSISITYADGSCGQVLYCTKGHRSMDKELYEAFGGARSLRCMDFSSLEAFGASPPPVKGDRGDKGQLGEMRAFVRALRGSSQPTDPDSEAGLLATEMALACHRSAREGCSIELGTWNEGH
jgi:polar amino acid transport system substrate-binding protein